MVMLQNPTHFDPGVVHFFERFGTNHSYCGRSPRLASRWRSARMAR